MSKVRLSERVRPDCEVAPWVVQEIKKLESENERLRETLKKYGDHSVDCMEGYEFDGPWPCDCGFEAALRGEDKG